MLLRNESSGEVTIANCTAYNNAANHGGGMFLRNDSSEDIIATNCTIYDNEADQQGGGMHLRSHSSGEVSIANCTAYDNEAAGSGGGIFLHSDSSGKMTVVNCTSYDNEASVNGGGMYLRNVSSGEVIAVNCTSYDNEATNTGGGMYLETVFSGEITIANCVAYGNEASVDGGGIALDNRSSEELTVANSIIYNNSAVGEGADVYNRFSKIKTLLSHCLLGSAVAGFSTAGTDYTLTVPVLGAPRFASPAAGAENFLRLQENSPAVDAGNNGLVPEGVTTDLAGDPRIQDGDEDGTATVNLGAYEGTVEAQTIYYVDAGVGGGADDGSSWANAYASLSAALAVASATDSIFVAAGTYKPSTDGVVDSGGAAAPRLATFNIPEGVEVYGGFAGTETSLEDRDLSTAGNETILSGDIGVAVGVDPTDLTDAGYDDNVYHVVSMEGANAVLDGFTVEAGRANGSGTGDYGGGVHVEATSITLRNLEVRYNQANQRGGGMYLLNTSSGEIIATNCVAYDNKAGTSGGGMDIRNESSGDIIATNCTAYDNEAGDNGGGMYLRNLSLSSGDIIATNCTAYDNEAAEDGGGMNLRNDSSGDIIATNCTAYGNQANRGGGMHLGNNSSGDIIATNCTVYDNEAADAGGGMFLRSNSSGDIIATNCTVYDNEAADAGGGMFLRNQSSGDLIVANGIIYGNTASTAGNDAYNNRVNTKTLLSHCLLGTAVAGNATAGTDYTLTAPVSGVPRFASTTAGDEDFLRLYNISPTVDAGNNDLVPEGVTTDLAGNNRIQDGDEDGTATVDLGAYEGAIEVPKIYVDAGVTGGADDGSSWANAYASLSDALAAVSYGDSLFVKAGSYTPFYGWFDQCEDCDLQHSCGG